MDVSRRDLLKTGAIGALGAATLGALSACSPSSTGSSSKSASANGEMETRFDVDVLIVGCGLAGFSSGLHILEKGIAAEKVLIIDKMSGTGLDYGGSSMVCSGNFLIAKDNTPEGQQAYVDAIYDVSAKMSNIELIDVLGEHANDTLDWMIENGCVYGEVKDYSAYDAVKQRTMESPGSVYYLREAYEGKGGPIEFGIKAQSLLTDAGGICGVIASDKNGYFKIAAKKTILCTGGYLGNPDMLETYIGESGGNVISRAPYSITGDGIKMVLAAGGYMSPNSHGVETIYLSCTSSDNIQAGHATRVLQYCIAVNANAERYADESIAGTTQDHVRALLNQPGCKMGMIADSKALEDLQPGIKAYEGWNIPIYTFETIDQAAGQLGVDIETLKATINEYNTHIVGDHTEGLAIDKTSKAKTIDTPPYYVFSPFVLTSSLTFGGIQANTDAQVIQPDGAIIPNLYAAGELIGNFYHDEYFGGTQQCKAAVYGYIAAEHAGNSLNA